MQTPQIRGRGTRPVYNNHQVWKPRPVHHVPHASAAKDQQDLLVYQWHKLQRFNAFPSSSRGNRRLISVCFTGKVNSLIKVPRWGAVRVHQENLLRTAFQTLLYIIYAQICTLQPRERQRQKKREGERERERILPGGKEELIKKREVQDHAFTLKSLFTSKLTFLTLQPLIYICLLSNWVLPTTREQKGAFLIVSSPSLLNVNKNVFCTSWMAQKVVKMLNNSPQMENAKLVQNMHGLCTGKRGIIGIKLQYITRWYSWDLLE